MLKESAKLPAVKAMLATAKKVLGYDLLALCLNGPKEALDDTVAAQPALFVAGLAAVERLRATDAAAVEGCAAAAGLSLGEYTALVFAGALSFEDGLRVVKARAEAMKAAAGAGEPHAVCQVANLLFPQGRVVSGHRDALEVAQRGATARGALKAVPVAVSGAFHTPLMAPARAALAAALDAVEVRDPAIPVYSNVTGEPFRDAAHVRELLPRQLCEPVRWEPTLRALVAAGKTQLSELGPGAQIKAMVKRVDANAWKGFRNVAA
jgi:[acyl-carrier-protein] S-malonyltransferase